MVMPTVASAAAASLHPVVSTRRLGVGDGNAFPAAGGRRAAAAAAGSVRARVAEAAPVAAEGSRQREAQEAPAAPMVEIPVTCYQVNNSRRLVFCLPIANAAPVRFLYY
jgi:hypothetical protein